MHLIHAKVEYNIPKFSFRLNHQVHDALHLQKCMIKWTGPNVIIFSATIYFICELLNGKLHRFHLLKSQSFWNWTLVLHWMLPSKRVLCHLRAFICIDGLISIETMIDGHIWLANSYSHQTLGSSLSQTDISFEFVCVCEHLPISQMRMLNMIQSNKCLGCE